MSLDLASARHAVVVVSHIPLVTLSVRDEAGGMYAISARPRAGELAVEGLRNLLVRAAFTTGGVEEALRPFFRARRPVEMSLHDDPPITRRLSDRHWRHSCVCRVVDYFVSECDRDRAVAVAEQTLGAVLPSAPRRLWGRQDVDLEMSVVAFEWPSAGAGEVYLRLEEALESAESALRSAEAITAGGPAAT